jgi:hypothetical protein
METLLKINTSIFGETGASSRLTQLTVKGLTLSRKPARPRSAQHLPISCGTAADADFINQLLGDHSHGKTEE